MLGQMTSVRSNHDTQSERRSIVKQFIVTCFENQTSRRPCDGPPAKYAAEGRLQPNEMRASMSAASPESAWYAVQSGYKCCRMRNNAWPWDNMESTPQPICQYLAKRILQFRF
eukprot:5406830-Pleurochrysis_carterae.AAC.1